MDLQQNPSLIWVFLANPLKSLEHYSQEAIQARKGRVWFQVDPGVAAVKLGTDRERVLRALDWLGEQGMLEVKTAGVRHSYRVLRRPEDPEALADALHGYNLEREAAELARLERMMSLVQGDQCLSLALAAHFGERMKHPCGDCSWCHSGPVRVPDRASREIPGELWDQIGTAISDAAGGLDGPRALTRFLCGIQSPRLGRARLGRHALFGRLMEVPFREVMRWVADRLGRDSAATATE